MMRPNVAKAIDGDLVAAVNPGCARSRLRGACYDQ